MSSGRRQAHRRRLRQVPGGPRQEGQRRGQGRRHRTQGFLHRRRREDERSKRVVPRPDQSPGGCDRGGAQDGGGEGRGSVEDDRDRGAREGRQAVLHAVQGDEGGSQGGQGLIKD